MDLLSIIQTVLRRWYIAVPFGLLTLVGAALVQTTVPPQYEARGSLLIEEPELSPSGLPSSVANAGTLLTELSLSAAPSDFAPPDGELVPQARDSTTIAFTATSGDPSAAEAAVNEIATWTIDRVASLQVDDGIPTEDQIRAALVTPTVAAEALPNGSFQASGTVSLQDPSAGSVNPFGAGSSTTGLLRTVVLSDAGTAAIHAETGDDITFDIGVGGDNAAIITVTTVARDEDRSIAAFDTVREALDSELQSRQIRAQVPEPRRNRIVDLAAPRTVEDVSPPLSRAVAAVVGAGGLLTLGIVLALDTVLRRRRSERPFEEADLPEPAALAAAGRRR